MADFPYPGKFTFVDVEIPNLNNDCICAISMIVIDEGQEVLRTTELINPRTFFSANNIKIHNIHRKDVLDKRTLKEFWADYGMYFEEPYIIGAHNAMSDISVLNKDLARFQEEIHASEYIDTMDIMEQFYYRGNQKKGDLKLCNIAAHLGIELDHHNPESDVNACYEIVRYMHRYFSMDLTPFIKQIRRTKMKPGRHQARPSTRQIKLFLSYTRRQIKNQTPPVRISAWKARKNGDQAFEAGDYEGVIFNYEIAASRRWQSPTLYLRLAEVYLSLNMHYDALRILDQGIRNLRRNKKSWQPLKTLQHDIQQLRQKEQRNHFKNASGIQSVEQSGDSLTGSHCSSAPTKISSPAAEQKDRKADSSLKTGQSDRKKQTETIRSA